MKGPRYISNCFCIEMMAETAGEILGELITPNNLEGQHGVST